MTRILHVLLIGLAVTCVLTGADWPRFRGPGGLGISESEKLPVKWSESDGVAWKTELPGPGSSSPIVAGNRVFVTCYTGYGVEGASGSPEQLERLIVCADLDTGKILWRASEKSRHSVTRAGNFGLREHHYASHTPVTDGERVYAFLGSSGVVAYDLSGKRLWQAEVADDPGTAGFGSASSPILYQDVVIVPATVESEAIVAFDRKTGKETWRATASGYGGSWTTPILVDAAGGAKELVISLPDEVWGLNPENGKLRWYAATRISGGAVCPSVISHRDLVVATGGRSGRMVAIRLGGRGELTGSHIAWTASVGSYVPSPVAHDGHIYWVNDRGIAYCLDGKTGETAYRSRLGDDVGVYASILLGGGHLYVVTRRSGTFVLATGPEFKLIARNELPSDGSDFNGSPAAVADRLILRSNRFLYCVGGTDKK